jgi:hypothetical protein
MSYAQDPLIPPPGEPSEIKAGTLIDCIWEQGQGWSRLISPDPSRNRLILHVRRIACLRDFQVPLATEGCWGYFANLNGPEDVLDALDCCSAIGRGDLAAILRQGIELAKPLIRGTTVDNDDQLMDALEKLGSTWDQALEKQDLTEALRLYIVDNFSEIFESGE